MLLLLQLWLAATLALLCLLGVVIGGQAIVQALLRTLRSRRPSIWTRTPTRAMSSRSD